MLTIILNLILINLGVVLIYTSGFFENMDAWVNEKMPPYHLPYPFHCTLCGTWWISLLWLVFSGNFSLLGVVLCLASAHLTEITTPLVRLVKNLLLGIINQINQLVAKLL